MFLYPTFMRSISSAVGGEAPAAKAGEEFIVEDVRVTRAVDPARMKRSRRDACMAVEEEARLFFLLATCEGANA